MVTLERPTERNPQPILPKEQRIVTFHQANGIQRELPAAPKRTTGYPPQCFCDLSGDKGTLGLSQESPWRLALTLK